MDELEKNFNEAKQVGLTVGEKSALDNVIRAHIEANRLPGNRIEKLPGNHGYRVTEYLAYAIVGAAVAIIAVIYFARTEPVPAPIPAPEENIEENILKPKPEPEPAPQPNPEPAPSPEPNPGPEPINQEPTPVTSTSATSSSWERLRHLQ